MLDLCRDPSDTPGVAFGAGDEPASFASDCLAALASISLRNCSLFIVAEQSLLRGVRGWKKRRRHGARVKDETNVGQVQGLAYTLAYPGLGPILTGSRMTLKRR